MKNNPNEIGGGCLSFTVHRTSAIVHPYYDTTKINIRVLPKFDKLGNVTNKGLYRRRAKYILQKKITPSGDRIH